MYSSRSGQTVRSMKGSVTATAFTICGFQIGGSSLFLLGCRHTLLTFSEVTVEPVDNTTAIVHDVRESSRIFPLSSIFRIHELFSSSLAG
jgi:hypothetical protein